MKRSTVWVSQSMTGGAVSKLSVSIFLSLGCFRWKPQHRIRGESWQTARKLYTMIVEFCPVPPRSPICGTSFCTLFDFAIGSALSPGSTLFLRQTGVLGYWAAIQSQSHIMCKKSELSQWTPRQKLFRFYLSIEIDLLNCFIFNI